MTKIEYTEKIKEIIDDYAGMVDDDSAFFVKPEQRNPYLERILSLLPDLVRSILPDKEDVTTRFYDEDTHTFDQAIGFNGCLYQIENRLKTWESEGK